MAVTAEAARAAAQARLTPKLTGATRLVGLLGWPVAHSRSPVMHNAAFAALGLDYVYVPLPVHPDRVGAAVKGLPALGFVGANVTVPHKSAVLPYLAELTPIAATVGAANTLVVRSDGTLLGDNTDGPGLLSDLVSHGVEVGMLTNVIVLGAGGAARAAVYALAEAGAQVTIANRTLPRAEELCRITQTALPLARLAAVEMPQGIAAVAQQADLVVNATSLGLHKDVDPLPWDPATAFHTGQVVYDMVYTSETPLLAMARAGGARAISGLGMLVYQGALAFTRWTGWPAPVDVMQKAVE